MEIVPAINCHYQDWECISTKVQLAEKFSDWIHLDVADARFTYNKTWNEPERWLELKTKLNLEVHLMVEEPEKEIERWLKIGARRLVVHLETVNENSFKEIRTAVAKFGAELMLSVAPLSPMEGLDPYFENLSQFQILAVEPGLAGQKFLANVIPKIEFLRQKLPNAKIEVDGGINLETAAMVKKAGADVVVSASYIFDSSQPEKAYKELKNV